MEPDSKSQILGIGERGKVNEMPLEISFCQNKLFQFNKRQFKCKATLKHVRVTSFLWKSNVYEILSVRCLFSFLSHTACKSHLFCTVLYRHLCLTGCTIFSTLPKKDTIFIKNILNKKYMFWFYL